VSAVAFSFFAFIHIYRRIFIVVINRNFVHYCMVRDSSDRLPWL